MRNWYAHRMQTKYMHIRKFPNVGERGVRLGEKKKLIWKFSERLQRCKWNGERRYLQLYCLEAGRFISEGAYHRLLVVFLHDLGGGGGDLLNVALLGLLLWLLGSDLHRGGSDQACLLVVGRDRRVGRLLGNGSRLRAVWRLVFVLLGSRRYNTT